jgi:DNA-binding LacI/PurR family transcriptional regulator
LKVNHAVRTVTIREVAKEAQSSITSVSHILRESNGYSYHADTIARVREAADRLGYQAHAAARLLRQQQRTIIGIAVRTEILTRPSLNPLIVATERELAAYDYQTTLIDPSQMIPSHSRTPFPSPEMVAGIISADLSMETKVPEFYQALQTKLPVVALYPVKEATVDYVTTDRACAIEMAVQHLVELGHCRIAFAENIERGGVTTISKMRGWKRARTKYALAAEPEYTINLPEALSNPSRITNAGRYIAAAFAAMKRPATALICTGDEMAMSAMRHLQESGVRVPTDVSVIGFDGVSYGEYISPPLTTIAQPWDEIARCSVQRLIELIEQRRSGAVLPQAEPPPVARLLKPVLVVRSSTAPPPL